MTVFVNIYFRSKDMASEAENYAKTLNKNNVISRENTTLKIESPTMESLQNTTSLILKKYRQAVAGKIFTDGKVVIRI